MEIPGYHDFREFARYGPFVVHRARRVTDEQAVLVQTSAQEPGRRVDSDALERHFELVRRSSMSAIAYALDLVTHGTRTSVVLADAGFIPLQDTLRRGRLDLATFYRVAIDVCAVLDELERRQLVHGAIASSSILIGPTPGDVELLNLGLAQVRWSDGAEDGRAESAVAYLSPEQTGRMNRPVDYRTDFYSLGIVLYEALIGARPFMSHDPLELIHAHIARTPTPPHHLDARVPEQLSRIVLKLLAKAAEDRYQSARGLARDLERCRLEAADGSAVSLFRLGQQDVPARFLVSQKLYGRDRELKDLLGAFDRTCKGGVSLMLVAGYSGIGKTSLIHELYKPIVRERGYFISGKFDQVVRNIPYGAFSQALRGLVWQLLTENETRLAEWRTRLSSALGANGGVLADVIPEIELILGKQPPPPPLDPTEARNRFGYVFQSLVGALAGADHPLVVFLDDLQWADAATLELLHALLTGPDIRHLLIIGAYRDNEVDAGHLLTWMTSRLESAGATVARLSLGPLELHDLTSFLSDTLHRDEPYLQPLAQLTRKKTDGNPFFVIQFLKALEQEGHIAFDHERAGWSFDMDAIAAAGMTDNVVDLMSRKIQRLSARAQRVVTLAACVGNQFDWDTVLAVSGQPEDDAAQGLREAVEAGLIQSSNERMGLATVGTQAGGTLAFLHDRVQQAAYALIPDGDKQPLHLAVGRLLSAAVDLERPDERIFTVANHLNMGSDLISSTSERTSLAALNLSAGRRTKMSGAYRAAVDYLERGLALLDARAWQTTYDVVFALHLELAESLYLAGIFDRAELGFRNLLDKAATPLDRAQVHSLQIRLYENQSRWADAVSATRDGLKLFDIDLPAAPDDKAAALQREVETVRQLVGSRSIGSLVNLADMTDPNMRMVLRLLTTGWATAYISGDQIFARLISAVMVRISLEHGNTEDSAYGYVTHAITVGPIHRDYRSAYEWGELALSVNRRFNDLRHRAKIHQQFQAHVNLWRRPFDTCIPHAREARRCGLDSGDFAYAGYGAATEAWSAWLVNRDLEQFVREFSPTLALLDKIKMTDFLGAHQVMLHWALALQGRTAGPMALSGRTFDEGAFIAHYEATAPFFLTFVFTAKLHLGVLFERYAEAATAAARAADVAVTGTMWPVLIGFWGGLATAAQLETLGPGEREREWTRLLALQASLEELADSCPENFRAFSLLISAEIAQARDDTAGATTLYQEATDWARHTNSVQHEALASELCARMWLRRGDETRAASGLRAAYSCYVTWGATAKLAHLEERYGHLLGPDQRVTMTPPADVSSGSATGSAASVDITTVLKVAHAIAVEIEVDALLQTLMKLALENAGAQRGAFIHERNGVLVVDAEADAASDRVETRAATPLEDAQHVATSVVRYVHRTGDGVVVGSATTDERFAADPYIARSHAKSILCVPVGHQGNQSGLLYLENNLTTDAFTPDRIEVMRVLAAQTAISLDNARLYEDMRAEVDRRTSAEQALREALVEVEALKNRLEAENVYLQEEIRTQHNFNEIVGNSPALLSVLRNIERVAPTDSTVLILGETGSGKELFARAIHSRSKRRARPLVKVNCGAISPGLVESELFGHVKGAFTGAIDKRVGRFELADGGTIFLDEIGELPLDAQVKLLRVLQEQEFEPVGSSRTVRVSVRVIAATNRDLSRAVSEGRFRADLLYRLNVFPLTVPALRERASDVPLLAGFFVDSAARKLGKLIQGFSARSMRQLTTYGWPGNVRELQNVVERAAILGQGSVLELDDSLLATTPVAPASIEPNAPTAKPESLDAAQRLHILEVLRMTDGVVEGTKGAAVILGLHPNTLRSRMKKLGISTTPRRAS